MAYTKTTLVNPNNSNKVVAEVCTWMLKHIEYMDPEVIQENIEKAFDLYFDAMYISEDLPIPLNNKKGLKWFDHIIVVGNEEEQYRPGAFKDKLIDYCWECFLASEHMPANLRSR